VPSLLVVISLLLRVIGNQYLFTGVMVYALIRLFINIRFKISQEKFQEAILSHIDEIVEEMDEEEQNGIQ